MLSTRGQSNCLTFDHSLQFQTSPQKQISEPSWAEVTKICPDGPGHMTKMAIMPIDSKNL